MSKKVMAPLPTHTVRLMWAILFVCGGISLLTSVWHAFQKPVAWPIAILGGIAPALISALLSPLLHVRDLAFFDRWALRIVFIGAMTLSVKALHDSVLPVFGEGFAWVFPGFLDLTTIIVLNMIMAAAGAKAAAEAARVEAEQRARQEAALAQARAQEAAAEAERRAAEARLRAEAKAKRRARLQPPLGNGGHPLQAPGGTPPRELLPGPSGTPSGLPPLTPSGNTPSAGSVTGAGAAMRNAHRRGKMTVAEIVSDIIEFASVDFPKSSPGTDKIQEVYGGGYPKAKEVRDKLKERFSDSTAWPPPAAPAALHSVKNVS